MLSISHRRRLTLSLTLLGALATVGALPPAHATAQVVAVSSRAALPSRISDRAFWRLITELSEEGGYFRSDNFVSNEVTFQHIIPELRRVVGGGGVYLGVGPDQNFTYIVALEPRMAFIIDIRRQNMLQHLLYKVLVEMSVDRAEFISRLFSRPRPRGLDPDVSPGALFRAFAAMPADSAAFRRNLRAVKDRLVNRHRFALSRDDLRSLEYVYAAFHGAGPDLTYTFSTPGGAQFAPRRMPTYAELMQENDGHGEHRSYLASEAHYRALRTLHQNNLIVPLVGDFAGDKAIRLVGRYLRERGASVSVFYTSNVEQYLFRQDDAWKNFFANVQTLPLDSSSVFVRAVFNFPRSFDQPPSPGPRSVTLLSPIVETVRAFYEGRVQSYFDVIQLSSATVPAGRQ